MTSINESLPIGVPYVRARGYLHETLEDAASSRLPRLQHVTANIPGLGIEIEKGVRVTYAHGKDPMHFDEPWAVGWTPEPGGMYPSFTGTLTVRADEDYTGAILELAGTYEPPLGATGRLFDKALGQRIAGSTMQSILSTIAVEMKKRYENEEAAKTRS